MNDCTSKNKLLFFGSLGLNIFLIAFYLGAHQHWRHCHFGWRGQAWRHEESFGQGRFGGRDMHGQPFVMSELFSRSEIESNREFIRERLNHIQAVRKDLAEALKNGKATPDVVKAHLAQIDQIRNEIRANMEQKVMQKINSMTPEEKSRFGNSLVAKYDEKKDQQQE